MIETEIEDAVAIERTSNATTATKEDTLLGIAKAAEDHDLEIEIGMATEGAEEADLLVMTATDAKDQEDQEVAQEDLMIGTGPDLQMKTTEIDEVRDTIGIEEIEAIDSRAERINPTETETTIEVVETETEKTEEMTEVIEIEEREIDLPSPGMIKATRGAVTDPDLLHQGTETMTETIEAASRRRTDRRDWAGQADPLTEDPMPLVPRMTSGPLRDGRTARSHITSLSPEMRTVTGKMTTSRITQTRTVPIQKLEATVMEAMSEMILKEEMEMLKDKTMVVIENSQRYY